MEWAYLYTSVVNLDQERNQLQSEGHTLRGSKNILEEKYRSHSDKNGFACPTCRNPVRMVLDTPCYFRHERDDHSRCPSTDNMATYEKNTQAEDKKVHRVGKQIIRTVLEGHARIHGAMVKEGYFFNKRLSIVPDFIIEFPNSEKVWAIDYITGLKQNENYTNQIIRRKDIYRRHGIKPFFFLDIKWLTVHPDSDLLALLVPAEHQLSTVSPKDKKWSDLLQEREQEIGGWYVSEGRQFSWYRPYPVHHVLYLDPHERKAHVLRYLSTGAEWNPLVSNPIELSLEKALSMDQEQITFRDVSDTQLEDPEWFIQRLREVHQPIAAIIAHMQQELRRRQEEERNRIRRLEEENERNRRSSRETPVGLKDRSDEGSSYDRHPLPKPSPSQAEMQFVNKAQMQHIQRILSFYEEIQVPLNEHLLQSHKLVKQFNANGYLDHRNRNVLVNSMQMLEHDVKLSLDQFQAKGNLLPSFLQMPIKLDLIRYRSDMKPPASANADLPPLEKMRKEKLMKVFKAKIVGDSYLSSPTDEWEGIQVPLWRMIVLKNYKKFAAGQITIAEILEMLQANGVVFTQSTTLIQHPVQQLIDAIEKVSQV